jgi:hypothetical protein
MRGKSKINTLNTILLTFIIIASSFGVLSSDITASYYSSAKETNYIQYVISTDIQARVFKG